MALRTFNFALVGSAGNGATTIVDGKPNPTVTYYLPVGTVATVDYKKRKVIIEQALSKEDVEDFGPFTTDRCSIRVPGSVNLVTKKLDFCLNTDAGPVIGQRQYEEEKNQLVRNADASMKAAREAHEAEINILKQQLEEARDSIHAFDGINHQLPCEVLELGDYGTCSRADVKKFLDQIDKLKEDLALSNKAFEDYRKMFLNYANETREFQVSLEKKCFKKETDLDFALSKINSCETIIVDLTIENKQLKQQLASLQK